MPRVLLSVLGWACRSHAHVALSEPSTLVMGARQEADGAVGALYLAPQQSAGSPLLQEGRAGWQPSSPPATSYLTAGFWGVLALLNISYCPCFTSFLVYKPLEPLGWRWKD